MGDVLLILHRMSRESKNSLFQKKKIIFLQCFNQRDSNISEKKSFYNDLILQKRCDNTMLYEKKKNDYIILYELRREKTGLRGF